MSRDVNPSIIVAGEVRQIFVKRDYVDTETGEVTPKSGRTLSVLTLGGFLKLSVPTKFDGDDFQEGQLLLAKADVVDWSMPRRNGNGDIHGTAFVYTAKLTADDLAALQPRALASK